MGTQKSVHCQLMAHRGTALTLGGWLAALKRGQGGGAFESD